MPSLIFWHIFIAKSGKRVLKTVFFAAVVENGQYDNVIHVEHACASVRKSIKNKILWKQC